MVSLTAYPLQALNDREISFCLSILVGDVAGASPELHLTVKPCVCLARVPSHSSYDSSLGNILFDPYTVLRDFSLSSQQMAPSSESRNRSCLASSG